MQHTSCFGVGVVTRTAMTSDPSDSLQPALTEAQAALQEALDEACTADVERLDTGEVIRIEEVLAIANDAAKRVVSVKRRMRRDQEAAQQASDERVDD
jgi:hypothetical protein